MDLNQTGEHKTGMGKAETSATLDFEGQRLRILRCTAQAMASSPGGLRFRAGTRTWLEGLPAGRPNAAVSSPSPVCLSPRATPCAHKPP